MIVVTCGLTPFFLAFPEQQVAGLKIFEQIMNVFFLIDIIVNFFSAYYETDLKIIDDSKVTYSLFNTYSLLQLGTSRVGLQSTL